MSVDNNQKSQAMEIHKEENQNIRDQHEHDKQDMNGSFEKINEQANEESKTKLNDQRNEQLYAESQIEDQGDKSKTPKDSNSSLEKENKKDLISPLENQQIKDNNQGDHYVSSQNDELIAGQENNGSSLSEQHPQTKSIKDVKPDGEIVGKSKGNHEKGTQLHENGIVQEKDAHKKDNSNDKQSNKLVQMIEILQGQQENEDKEIVTKKDTNNKDVQPQHGQDNNVHDDHQPPSSALKREKSGTSLEKSKQNEYQESPTSQGKINTEQEDNEDDEQAEEGQQEVLDNSGDNKQELQSAAQQESPQKNDLKLRTESSNDEYVSHADHQKSIASLKKALEMEQQSSSQYLQSSQNKNTENDEEDSNPKKMSDVDGNDQEDNQEQKLVEEQLSISQENKNNEGKEKKNNGETTSNEEQQSCVKSSDAISCSPNLKHSNISMLSPLQLMERRERNLHTVYKFYCKQSYVSGKYATFDRVLQETNIMSMGKFFLFVRDFQIVTRGIKKYKLVEMFKKTSSNSKELSFPEFLIVLERMAQLFPVEISSKADGSVVDKKEEFYQFLSLDDQSKLKEKVKNVNLPFHTHAKAEHIAAKDFPKLKPIKLTERDISLLSPIRNIKDKSLLHKDSAMTNSDNAKINNLSNIESVSETSAAPSAAAKQSPSPLKQPSSTKKPPLGISPSVNHKKQPKKLSQASSIEEVMKSCTWEKLLSSSISDLKQLIDDDFDPADLLDASNAEDDEYLEEYNSPARGNNIKKQQLDSQNDQNQIKIVSTDQDEDYEQEQWRVRSQRRKQRPAGSGLGTILNERGKSLPQQQIIPSKQLAQQEDYKRRQIILDNAGIPNNHQLDRKSSKSLQHRRDSPTKKIEPAQYQYQQQEEEDDDLRQQVPSRNNSSMNRRQPPQQQQQISLNAVNKKTVSKSDTKDNYSKKHSNSYHHSQPDQNQQQDTADIQINHIPQLRGNQGNHPAYKAIITRVKRSISDLPNQDNYYNESSAAGNVNINDQGYNVTLNPQSYVPQSYQQQQLSNILQYNPQSLQKINRSNVIIVHPQQNYGNQAQNKSYSHIVPDKHYQEGQNININDQGTKAGYLQGSESNSNIPKIVRRQKSTLIAEKDGGNRRAKERSVEGRLEENYKREVQDQESQSYIDRRSESLNKGPQNYSYKNYQNTNESKVSFVSKKQQQQQQHGQQQYRNNQPSNGYNMNSNTNISNGGGLNDSFQDQNNNYNNRMGNNNNNYHIQLDTNISSSNEINNKNKSLMLAANDVMNSNNPYSLTERQRQMVEDQRKRIAQVGVTLTQKSSKETKLVAQLLQGLRNKGKKIPAPAQERSYLFQE